MATPDIRVPRARGIGGERDVLQLPTLNSTRSIPRNNARPTGLRVRVTEGISAGAEAIGARDKPITVGTAPGNALQLGDETVSRYHLKLHAREHDIEVNDLRSMNGTFVDAVQVRRAVVPPGTALRLGASTLVVEPTAAPPTPRARSVEPIAGVVAASPAMLQVCRLVRRVAPSNVSILIEGETGTGKEVVARAIHHTSRYSEGPFVVLDCASIPPNLLASELFGHERGAFTGAHRRHRGAFERANGGTLFLDEVGELPLQLQPNLLGVLERREFRRVGGEERIPVDVRVVSATNRDLRAAANSGAFRTDLYFRLAVTRISIPPLRERPQDIEPLVEHFLRDLTDEPGFTLFDATTLETLSSHHFSGNVRELRNLVETALAMGQLPWIEGLTPPGAEVPADDDVMEPYRQARANALAAFERAYLSKLIASCGGNASEAARRGQMDRPYLLTLLRRNNLR